MDGTSRIDYVCVWPVYVGVFYPVNGKRELEETSYTFLYISYYCFKMLSFDIVNLLTYVFDIASDKFI